MALLSSPSSQPRVPAPQQAAVLGEFFQDSLSPVTHRGGGMAARLTVFKPEFFVYHPSDLEQVSVPRT